MTHITPSEALLGMGCNERMPRPQPCYYPFWGPERSCCIVHERFTKSNHRKDTAWSHVLAKARPEDLIYFEGGLIIRFHV